MIIHILLILQMTIINIITLNSVTISPTIKYAIPLIHGSNLYLFGNDKVLYSSNVINFETSYTNTTGLISTIEATTPLYNYQYIITYILFEDKFKYLKIYVGRISSTESRISNATLKGNGNVCFFQMIYQSNDYYYSAWIDRDSFINIERLDFDTRIKGINIDCKVFEAYGDIICVFVGYDDCNLNVYNKEVPNNYSQALLQQNNLFDLGYNCDISSTVQKIYNID